MNNKYKVVTLLLLGLVSKGECSKLMHSQEQKIRDWDDLLGDQSVFNAKSYSQDTPDGYTNVVNEVEKEKDQ